MPPGVVRVVAAVIIATDGENGVALPTGIILALLERAGFGAAECTADGAIAAVNDFANDIFAKIAVPDDASGVDRVGMIPAVLMPALGSAPAPLFIPVPGGRCIAAQVFTQPPSRAFLLIMADLNSRRQSPIHTLQRAFGLTRREARVASGLATGMPLQEIAVAQGVGMGTVRTHLKSIFAKTRTKRQAELVSLLGRLLPFA